MAKYDQLPIYRLALELTVFLEKTVRNFSRYHKYSIGERLRQTSWDVITMVVRAHRWLARLEEGRFRSVGDLAEAVGMDASLVRRHLGLTSLRPDLIRQILAGDEPEGLSLRELLLSVPVRWEEQRLESWTTVSR